MKLNERILEDLLAWGADLPAFERGHAQDALTLVQGYARALPDTSGLEFMALDLTFIFWVDDRFDAATSHNQRPMDWRPLVEVVHGEESPVTPEARAFLDLKRRARALARTDADYRLWLSTAEDFFFAWGVESALSRRELSLSYAEYLENGVSSTTVPHLLATMSLLYDLQMPARMQSIPFVEMVRSLALVSRLQNDLVSLARERRDHCLANAVLLLEEKLGAEIAQSFVETELEGYLRLLETSCERLGADDPFVRVPAMMFESQEDWARNRTNRYQTLPEWEMGNLGSMDVGCSLAAAL